MLPEAIARECATRLDELTHRYGLEPNGDHAQLGGECKGSRFHSPRPLLTYSVTLWDNSGRVRLCGVCRDNLRLLANLQDEDEPLPWDAMREFGNRIRAISRGEDPDT